MYNVDLTTKAEDIPVVYGLFNYGVVRDHALESLKYILTDITDLKKRYVTLGFHLWEFKENECYKDFGYDNFKEFCDKNIPLASSTISSCIKVWYRFALVQDGVRKMFLEDKYSDYEYSQLEQMVSMDSIELALVNPDMTVKEMRQLKKKVLVEPEALKRFVEYFKDDNEEFTKQNVMKRMLQSGESHSCYSNYPFNFQMKPGKASICGSKYYKFKQLLDAYEEQGNTLYSDKVRTSELQSTKVKRLAVSDLCDKKGIVLQKHIKAVEPEKENVLVSFYDENGKLVQCYDNYDLLLNENGTIILRFRKAEKDE